MICRRLIVGLILLGLELACSTIFWDLTMLSVFLFSFSQQRVWFNYCPTSHILYFSSNQSNKKKHSIYSNQTTTSTPNTIGFAVVWRSWKILIAMLSFKFWCTIQILGEKLTLQFCFFFFRAIYPRLAVLRGSRNLNFCGENCNHQVSDGMVHCFRKKKRRRKREEK